MLRNTVIARSQLKWRGESKHRLNGSPAKTAAELIEDLTNASQKGHHYESLATYTRPHVLVIEWGKVFRSGLTWGDV